MSFASRMPIVVIMEVAVQLAVDPVAQSPRRLERAAGVGSALAPKEAGPERTVWDDNVDDWWTEFFEGHFPTSSWWHLRRQAKGKWMSWRKG
jgi:hypothetical protein